MSRRRVVGIAAASCRDRGRVSGLDAAGDGGLLGNNAKYPAKPAVSRAESRIRFLEDDESSGWAVELESGVVRRYRLVGQRVVYESDPLERQAERYGLQGFAKKILPGHRIQHCHWTLRYNAEGVGVWKGENLAHFSGLQTCGSVWACPVCQSRIVQKRKQELQRALNMASLLGMRVFLVTFTVPHYREDDCAGLVRRMCSAFSWMLSTRNYKGLVAEFDIHGTIRALEVTYGDANGFHPHFHVLFFVKGSVSPEVLRDGLFRCWGGDDSARAGSKSRMGAAVAFGFPRPSPERGVDVRGGMEADEYVSDFDKDSQWGLTDELVRANSKRGRTLERMSPFDLLRGYRDGVVRCRHLFSNYVYAFHGRRQLVWSNGLKSLFGVVESSDQEVACESQAPATLIYEIPSYMWKRLLRYGSRARLLGLAQNGGVREVVEYLDGLGLLCFQSPVAID